MKAVADSLFLFRLLVPIIGAARVARKPSLVHPLLLFKDFQYAPKARKCSHTQHGLSQNVVHQQSRYATANSGKKKHPPHFHTKIVFALNHQRVKESDAQKSAKSNRESQQMVTT